MGGFGAVGTTAFGKVKKSLVYMQASLTKITRKKHIIKLDSS